MHILTNTSRLYTAGAVLGALLVLAVGAHTAQAAYDIGQYVSLLSPTPSQPAIGTAPTVTLSANPTSIVSGNSVTLTWSSTNSSSCAGTGFSTGGATSGSVSVSPTDTATYTLGCVGKGGTATGSATVTVTPVSTPVQVFADAFETSLSWTRVGDTTWYTGTPKNGTHSVRLRTTGYIEKTIPTTGYQNLTVSFSMGAYSLDSSAENVQALYYNGTSWVVLATIANGSANENNALNPYTLTLPSGVNNLSSFALRFKLNGSGTNDYGYIDDVVVTGTPTGVTPPQTQTVALWSTSTVPTNLAENDASAVELGVKFQSTQAGQVTGIRFYKSTQNTGTHTGSLYDSAGTLLARATFTNESASGWQEVTFSTPVDIVANTTYLASYHTPTGYYSYDSYYFANSHSNGILTAPSSSTSGGNGVYVYASTPTRPVSTWYETNYWVTPVVRAAAQ